MRRRQVFLNPSMVVGDGRQELFELARKAGSISGDFPCCVVVIVLVMTRYGREL